MVDTTTLNETLKSPIDGTENVRLATSGANWRSPLSTIINTLGREKVTATRNYYVATAGGGGSDSNDGLTALTPFLTGQHAFDVITETLDVAGFTIVINFAAGTYAGTITLVEWVGGGIITFNGDTVTPANVIFSADDAITATAPYAAKVVFQGFKHTGTGGRFISFGNAGGFLEYSNIEFAGASPASRHISGNVPSAFFSMAGPCTISAGSGYHIDLSNGGRWQVNGAQAITVTGSPAFGGAFLIVTDTSAFQTFGALSFPANTATGSRYTVSGNGVIDTAGSGANFFPGDTPGNAVTGGQYI